MKNCLSWLLLPVVAQLAPFAADTPRRGKPLELFVAVNGDDQWSGLRSEPNGKKSDGPFATLDRARDELRTLRQRGALAGGATVLVRGGMYGLTNTLLLTKEDSGNANAPIVYRAYKNERPILIGGKALTGFAPHKGEILKADVGAQGFKDVYFRQLFFAGERQHLARHPNFDPANPYAHGWAYVDGKLIGMWEEVKDEPRNLLHYKPDDFHDWKKWQEGEVFVFPRYNWINTVLGIKTIDREKRIYTLSDNAHYNIRAGDRYYVRNLFEELDAPGEWYLDKETWTLYFWPPNSIDTGAVYAPLLQTIVQIDGGSYITLRGFTIECCEGTGVLLNDASDCFVAGNVIRNVTGVSHPNFAAVLVEGGRKNGVVGNDIHHTGSSGIKLNGGDRATLTASEHYAVNNYVHHTGMVFKQGIGIGADGVGQRVAHNLIHDTPNLSLWFNGNDHVIEFNRLRHSSTETSDTGATYCGGRDFLTPRGTVLRHNYISDVVGFGRTSPTEPWHSPHFSWGIYLDDNSAGVDVIGNIVAHTHWGGIHLHSARDNVIENNIFIDGTVDQYQLNGWTKDYTGHLKEMVDAFEKFANLPAWQKYRGLRRDHPKDAQPMADNRFARNIFYITNPKAKLLQHRNLKASRTTIDYNLIWNATGQPLLTDLKDAAPDKQFAAWQQLGFDQNSIIADPRFKDAAKEDYRLKGDSPAFKLGFKPIPVERIGPYKDDLRASWPIIEAEGIRELIARGLDHWDKK